MNVSGVMARLPAKPCAVVLLAVIVGVAAWLRLRHAAGSMVYDDMASMYFSGQPWSRLWGWWMVRETNPPLFYSLLKVWRLVLPVSHWSIRALPLLITLGYFVVFGRFLWRRFGAPAGLTGLALLAISGSDIYLSDYVRGYGLARLAVLVSFSGLLDVLDAGRARRRGFVLYALGAIVAIYCHTTMLLWPAIATFAVLVDTALRRESQMRALVALIAADGAIGLASIWAIAIALAQIQTAGANIAWLQPLGWMAYKSTLNLQLLTDGAFSSATMGLLMIVGGWRNFARREVRLAIVIIFATLVLFRMADRVQPIVSNYTMHWCFTFTALVAAAAMQRGRDGESWRLRARRGLAIVAVCGAILVGGLADLLWIEHMAVPQDLGRTVRTVVAHPGSALLASHESVAVVLEQTCLVELHALPCPFPLVVMADPRPTDSWARGGFHGQLVAPEQVSGALGRADPVYVFSRYFYTPLPHLGLHAKRWHQVTWDDGELIGPIPAAAFGPPRPGEPPRVPDYAAQYTGVPTDSQ
jgi:hypothetical protein